LTQFRFPLAALTGPAAERGMFLQVSAQLVKLCCHLLAQTFQPDLAETGLGWMDLVETGFVDWYLYDWKHESC